MTTPSPGGPAWVKTAFDTALAHHQAGRLAEAEEIYCRILVQYPWHAETLHLFGVVAHQQRRFVEAIDAIRRAVAVNPERAAFYSNLGESHRELGQVDQAVECYRRAIQIEPDFAEAYNNLGLALRTRGDVAEATQSFQRAVALVPDYVNAHFNLGCIFLLAGDFQRGWAEYAWRKRMPWHPGREISLPEWDGAPILDKRLLLYAEQGLGDTLQFVRYLPLLADRAAEVVCVVQAPLVPILTDCGIEHVVPAGALTLPCDFAYPLASLPQRFGTSAPTIPAQTPYLRTNRQRVEQWRAQLAPVGGFKVGIAWQGSKSYFLDRYRSIPLAAFEPLARLPDVRLVSLQLGEAARQISDLAGRFDVWRFDDRFDVQQGAFMDSAAVIMNLDLVVTSDTAIAHLAGALGVPVWLALSAAPDWRWMLERSDSPWYPTMRLFRQRALGQWSDVFESIAAAMTTHRQP